MKVLGLNFGRDKMQCNSYLVEALAGAEKAGAEIEQINMCKLKINRCKGCGALYQRSRARQKEPQYLHYQGRFPGSNGQNS